MSNKSITVQSLVTLAIIFIASQANIIITEGELETGLALLIKLAGVITWIIFYVKRLERGDIKNIFTGTKNYKQN